MFGLIVMEASATGQQSFRCLFRVRADFKGLPLICFVCVS